MKKRWTERSYRQFQARHRRRSEARRHRAEIERRSRHLVARPTERTEGLTLAAPQVFSLVEAPDETVKFLNEFRKLLPTRRLRIKIDLEEVKKIHPEAVAAFVAIMESTNEGNVVGNTPRDRDCARRLQSFGFFEHVKGGPSHGETAGTIRKKHTGRKVEGDTARDIIEFGLRNLNGFPSTKHGPTYTIFTEAMTNTFQHADQREGRQKWWAAVYYDAAKQAACFTCVDVGVGILESFNFRQRWNLWVQRAGLLKQMDQGEKLRRLLNGDVPSRTGEKYRGRGLPRMKESCNAGRINNLSILSNKAFADIGQNAYQELTNDFRGTIIYWEVANAATAFEEDEE